ncbi:MAG TPA: aquaporin [Oceanipulchritudo sp.]|nr:aquaporin [Oceanipulchritudo sp.]
MKKYIVELIGTFFLVLTVGMTAVHAPGAGAMAPFAIGMVLAVMIFAGGPVSGGHYNPAVTLGCWIRGACPTADVLPYMGAQILGGVLAALVAGYLTDDAVSTMSLSMAPVLLVEFLFTFALVFVVLCTATAKFSEGNSYFGLAIGGTVMAGAYSVGSISGGAFNPAVAIGLVVMGAVCLSNIWLYLVACLAGGAVAGLLFKNVIVKD